MRKTALLSVFPAMFLTVLTVFAQQDTKPQTQVRVNYLNVCAPSKEEQSVLTFGLGKVAASPVFAEDFEMSRGRTTVKETGVSKFVRLRREFVSASPLLTVQYSMSADEKSIVELLVLRMRDPKELHEVSFEDSVSAGAASPVALLASDTPPVRIRVERLGKPSVVLTRCEGGDQSAYEPIFKQAAEIMARYRAAMALRTAFRSDITWLITGDKTAAAHPATKSHKKP
jgi:hypothetical protein